MVATDGEDDGGKATGGATAISPADLEEAVGKAVSSHFRKLELTLLAEVKKAVKAEAEGTIGPAVDASVTAAVEKSVAEPLRDAVSIAARESYKVKGREVVEGVCEGMRDPIVEAFNKTMREVMIPAYESATRQIFSQVSTAVESGLAAQKAAAAQKDGELIQTLQSMSAQMETMAKTIQALSTEVTQLRSAIGSAGGMAPAPQPPVVDPAQAVRDEILALLRSLDYEMAFTKALSASDGDIAIFACKNANISAVLEGSTGPALSQPILLCLMQQLGAVLSSSNPDDLRVELAWLQDIAVSLDPGDESIRRHVAGVLQQLVSNINEKMSQGDPALRRPLQMLLQVIRGMGAVS